MSGFENNSLNPSGAIDFSKAQKLQGTGTTCDIYVTTHYRRRVFVKRLKDSLRHNPINVAALEKEFEVGVSLKHKSLPEYREIHDDYIVMDFLEGATLSELLQKKDTWLSKEKNVTRLLNELIDVVDYLHQRNVVHCDIKPDNIILTIGNRNLMLIDLDKCFTDWLNDTSGSASKYGLTQNQPGDKSIDFHAIALLIDRILVAYPKIPKKRLNELKKLCLTKDISAADLKEFLTEDKRTGNKLWIYSFPLFVLVIVGLIIWRPKLETSSNDFQILTHEQSASSFERNESLLEENVSSVTDSNDDNLIPQYKASTTLPDTPVIQSNQPANQKDTVVVIHEIPIPTVSSEELIANAGPSKNYEIDIAQNINKQLQPIENLIKKAENLLGSNPTYAQMSDMIGDLIIQQSELSQKICRYYEQKYPEVNKVTIQLAVLQSDPYTKTSDKLSRIIQQLSDNIENLQKH